MSAEPSLGESIRQLRRQHSLTQSELGGEHFSKSYVSAVERDKIMPSYEAMRFFARQLEQPKDHFENIYHQQQQHERDNQANLLATPEMVLEPQASLAGQSYQAVPFQDSFLLLFDTVLAHSELYPYIPTQLTLSEDMMHIVTQLPLPMQGRFSFLLGRQQMQQGNFSSSLSALENALALAPRQYQPAILDNLGLNYYHRKDYYVALNYHQRALKLLYEQEEVLRGTNATSTVVEREQNRDQTNAIETPSDLRLKVTFHCGNACSALGAHQQAVMYYEQAYKLLSPAIDMQTMGALLMRLGYSIYAHTYQKLASAAPQNEVEDGFQRAISFIVQGRSVYQAAGDKKQESNARLLQATVLLDRIAWKRQIAQQKAQGTEQPPHLNYRSLLDEVEEQCRQALLLWLPTNRDEHMVSPSNEVATYLYNAMTGIVLAFAQDAEMAQLGGYSHTEQRSFALASHYCQQLLDSLEKDSFPWLLAYQFTTSPNGNIRYQSQSLPHIPQISTKHHALSRAIIFYTSAVVSEMLGHKATHPEYIYESYRRCDDYIHLALDNIQAAYRERLIDISHVVRYYQRCIALLETREEVARTQDVQLDGMLQYVLKDGLQKLAFPIL